MPHSAHETRQPAPRVCPKGMVLRMNATERIKQTGKHSRSIERRRGVLGFVGAVSLAAVMLFSVACTRDDVMHDPKDTAGTGAGTNAGTSMGTGAADSQPAGTPGTTTPDTGAKPLDPDAGTVNPDGNPSNPPADTGTSGTRSRFFH